MLETRLLHQYLTSTYHTLSEDDISAHHFSISIPRMATLFPYLLDSMFALSALHLASIEAVNRQPWINAALRYQSQACSGLGKVLSNISPQHQEPAFMSSVFIMLFATGLPSISPENRPTDPLSAVLEVRTLITGCAMLFNQINSFDSEGELKGWQCFSDRLEDLKKRNLNRYAISFQSMHQVLGIDIFCSDGLLDARMLKLLELHKKIMESLGRLHTTIDKLQGPEKVTYQTTWQLLYRAVEPWPKTGPYGGPIAWPLFINEEYLSLLQKGDWLARILFLHYGVCMRLLSHRWYVRDWGCQLVVATLEPLEEIPSEWVESVAWIRQAVDADS
ncbi:hypothetical protein N7474_003179 [Penicillium riverlandense]|uniref:uncharacterized protein n=1 Tax=Penicillium riverlandense TaxID=1903569 RepID=UPI002547F313|nr:uncharacterized protein N7474_003179 [Penicillium riverlandense]KAJ5826041.1 hypothetical protein N7474_003179 [Penicillium riverlandense]